MLWPPSAFGGGIGITAAARWLLALPQGNQEPMSDTGRVEAIAVTAEEAGARLDRVLTQRVAELSRSRLKALILDGQVSVSGVTVRDPSRSVRTGDRIVVE